MAINNFKNLEAEMEAKHPLPPDLEQKLHSNMNTFRFLGAVAELFLPKAVNVAIHLAGGRDQRGPDQPPVPRGPQEPGQERD